MSTSMSTSQSPSPTPTSCLSSPPRGKDVVGGKGPKEDLPESETPDSGTTGYQDHFPKPMTNHERVMSLLASHPPSPISHIYSQSSSLHLPPQKQRNCKVLKAFRSHYRTHFNAFIAQAYSRLPTPKPAKESPWRSALNLAVKEGKPARFDDRDPSLTCATYTAERFVPRCRSLYNLLMASTPLMSSFRSLFLGRGAASRPLAVASVGSGPCQDFVVLSALASYLRLLGYPPSPALYSPFDLYPDSWDGLLSSLRSGSCGSAYGDGLDPSVSSSAVSACDLRLPLPPSSGPDSDKAGTAKIRQADVVIFAYVLHENTHFLLSPSGGYGEGGAVVVLRRDTLLWGVLSCAKRGAIVLAVDSGDRLWGPVAAEAERHGWNVERREDVSMGPRSYLVMRRDEVVVVPAEHQRTVAEVIFDPARHFGRQVTVRGSVRYVLSPALRFDIGDGGGGKLIVDAAGAVADNGALPKVGEDVRVRGEVKKRQRRTVLVATHVTSVGGTPPPPPTTTTPPERGKADIPAVLPMLVAPWLPANDFSSLAMASRAFEAECSDDCHWKARAEKDFGVKRHGKQSPGFWRKLYLEVHAEQIEEDALVDLGMC